MASETCWAMWKCSQARTRCVSIHSLNWEHTYPSRISRSPPRFVDSFTEVHQDYKNYSSKYCYRMPNSVQLIQMPHRCGYGIVPLPETIKPYINTTLAWDNIDRLEETLSGGVAKKPMARLDLTFLSVMRFKSHWKSSDISRISMYLLLKWLLFTKFQCSPSRKRIRSS